MSMMFGCGIKRWRRVKQPFGPVLSPGRKARYRRIQRHVEAQDVARLLDDYDADYRRIRRPRINDWRLWRCR